MNPLLTITSPYVLQSIWDHQGTWKCGSDIQSIYMSSPHPCHIKLGPQTWSKKALSIILSLLNQNGPNAKNHGGHRFSCPPQIGTTELDAPTNLSVKRLCIFKKTVAWWRLNFPAQKGSGTKHTSRVLCRVIIGVRQKLLCKERDRMQEEVCWPLFCRLERQKEF